MICSYLSPPNGVGLGPLCPDPQGLTDGPVACGDSRGPGKSCPSSWGVHVSHASPGVGGLRQLPF